MKSKLVYYNPNPLKKDSADCVVRALCAIEGKDWDMVYKELCDIGMIIKDMPNAKLVYTEYLSCHGFIRIPISNKKGSKRPTVNEMAVKFPDGAVCEVANHMVTVKDKKIFDTWDSGKKCLYGYWVKEEV